ncbi:hypothetical protein ASG52_21705 [Methylobacterium sp. Leaf456]|nr:hypothetical protein ASG52_21705 [Methylobacterium sp. Leaf456]
MPAAAQAQTSTRAAEPEGEKAPAVTVTDGSFKCLLDMKKVRHFYVDNLSGRLDETVKVAEAGEGEYPEGSVVQLVPNEVMIKQQKGFSPITRDWEFFWIDVDGDGSKIFRRGFVEVNNRFEMNCFACHVKADAKNDFTCGADGGGCDPIPLTREMFGALQRTDPRCKNAPPVSAADQAALKMVGEVVAAMKEANASNRTMSEDAPKK